MRRVAHCLDEPMPKRLFSHNTLERKIRLIFGLMILLVIVAAFWFPWSQMERLLTDRDIASARALAKDAFDRLHVISLSEESHSHLRTLDKIGPPSARPDADRPYVIPFDALTGNPLLDADAARTNPEALIHFGPPRDNRERRWLEKFAADPRIGDDYDSEYRETGYFLRYAAPQRAREGCIDCHRSKSPAIKEGDLMGAIVITFPVESTRTVIKANRIILVGAAIVTAVLSMIVFYAVVRLIIVQPVKHLKRVADRVTEGDLDIRAELETGDEFETLSKSFNRMLQRLDASQEELRRANVSLDRKLEELARANVSLFEMNQMKSKFLTTMSHELRTPLNAIIGFAEILISNPTIETDPKLARYMTNIQRSGNLLLDIINDLLDLAKIEAGKMAVSLDQVSPLDISEASMNMVRPMVGAKDLRLELDVADACPIMTTDANKLQQILYNLLSNAVKFTPSGAVRLTVRPLDAETMFFQVSDTGPGLSADQQKVIFERFSQVDSGHTRQYGGTGLGLSIVKELVEVLGGDVAVQSELGEGASFNVTLPVKCAPQQASDEEAPVTKVEAEPVQKEATGEEAPEPVTPEDTVLALDVEADALKPDESDSDAEANDAPADELTDRSQ
jgi:two-component system, NarL family, sensor histidine kinase BarA